jgi:hypothetical protein
MISIQNFKDILISKSGGKPLGKVANFYALCYQAMTAVKTKVDLPSSMRTAQLVNPVYSNVKMYPLPNDITLDGIINLRPIVADDSYLDFTHVNGRQFVVEDKFNFAKKRLGIRNINGVQYILISDTTTEPLLINPCDSLTSNGTVTAIGATTNVAVDGLQKVSGGASISFSTGTGASNGLEGTLLTPVDLSGQNNLMAYVWVPSLVGFTGVKLSFGQDNGNYFSGSTATDFFGNAITVGWNLVSIPKTSFAIGAGSPTWTNVDYWRYEVLGTLTGTIANWRIDSIVGQVGALFEIDYYATNQFQDANGNRIEKPQADTDNIIISGDEIDLFTNQFIEIMTIDLKQQGSGADYQEYGGNKLILKYEEFKFKFPSLRQLKTTQYAGKPNIF